MPVVKKLLPGRTYIFFASEPSPELLKELQADVDAAIREELAKYAAKRTATDSDAGTEPGTPAGGHSR